MTPVPRLLDNYIGLWYNDCRGHMTLGGALPGSLHRGEKWDKPDRSARARPPNVERRFFPDVRITAYRLAA